MITQEEYEEAQEIVWDYEDQLKEQGKAFDTSNESALNIDLVSNKGDYVEYKGGSTSKLLIKGNKYRLTCSPFRDRIAVINEGGSRMNTLKKYFDC